MKKKLLRNADWGILVCVILLAIIGLVALFSATESSGLEEFKKQLLWICIGILVMLIIIFIDYELIAKISPVLLRNIYCINNRSVVRKPNKWCKKMV